jgi:hypothetical protein
MGVYAGPANAWSNRTDSNRIDAATKVLVQSGLVLNLDAGASTSYPGSGTTWTDLSGRGNNGTFGSGAAPTYSGANGGSLVFDRTKYINLGDPASLQFGTEDWSFECWFNANNISYGGNDSAMIISKNSFTSFESFFYGGAFANWVANGGVATNNISTPTWGTGIWYHTVYSKTSGVYNVYQNAVLCGQTANSSNISGSGSSWCIGQRSLGGGLGFNGYISIIRMYNKGLTQTEISQNFNATRSRYGI